MNFVTCSIIMIYNLVRFRIFEQVGYYMTAIGKNIKKLRKSKNLTQEEFGKLFGIVKSTVSMYESGKSTPDDELKKKIANYFDVTLDYLMGVSNIKNPYKEENSLNYIKLDVKDLPEEAIKQIEEYIEFIKQKYDIDKTSKNNKE